MNQDWVVVADDLVKTYKMGEMEVNALRGASVKIARGEVVSIMGPSGSGKSTMMNILGCLDRPTSGSYTLDGELVANMTDDQLASVRNRKVGFVFQSFNLLSRQTALFNVELPLRYSGNVENRRERAADALKAVGLENRMMHRPAELSGGQQQRVALARALVKLPKVLLLDEPLGALDLKLRKEMQIELKSIQQKVGITFVYVTHDQQEALTMSDRIAVMSKGKVLQMGPPVEVYERPNSRFVADFIGESNFLAGTVREAEGEYALVYVPALNAEIKGLNTGGVSVGQNVVVSIRPEKIRLSEQPALKINAFRGQVTNTTYIGSDTHVYVDLGGQKLKVWEQNKISSLDPKAYYSMGQNVWLNLFPENTLVLAES